MPTCAGFHPQVRWNSAGVQMPTAYETSGTIAKPASMGTSVADRLRTIFTTSPAGSDAVPPVPRRAGSRYSRKAGTSSSPGAPMSRKAACHGASEDSGPLASTGEVASHCNSAPPPM